MSGYGFGVVPDEDDAPNTTPRSRYDDATSYEFYEEFFVLCVRPAGGSTNGEFSCTESMQFVSVCVVLRSTLETAATSLHVPAMDGGLTSLRVALFVHSPFFDMPHSMFFNVPVLTSAPHLDVHTHTLLYILHTSTTAFFVQK